ncbi:DoxX family protein [Pseudoflavitalea sp. X16]|uniref:DoxX family protein n=1 Tax=Paraflavitalea devenefica TaxID=2716334 RepID=UPI0014227197|nr:DoxX family protein [Paraflavitalea devenefica]NII28749.1 DoxX family protein [Paraflavitalea devenefica]
MKTTNILYWIFTSLFGAFMLMSAIPDIFSHPIAIQGMHTELGYPLYFIPFIGVAKFLGVIAILLPGFHRLKEWAYAGFAYDLIGATYSVFSIGKPDWVYMLLFVAFYTFTYILYRKRKKLLEQAKLAPRAEGVLVTSAMA